MEDSPVEAPERKIILAGVGGQGVVFLTRLLAQAAITMGYPVMVSETHGMSQRGGSVLSHLKIGGGEAPLIRRGTADLLLALEPDEAVRSLPFLARGGTAIVNSEDGLRAEVAEHLDRLSIWVLCLPAVRMAQELGSAAVTNALLAGFAAAFPALPLPITALQEAVETIARRGAELNLRALQVGFQAGQETLRELS